jgi:catechol 2,3-dioxygenase-like lactoylglutathione lyase family enzyme
VSAPGLQAFHVGIVVRDVDATADLYGRILGVRRWRRSEFLLRKPPWDDWMTDCLVKIAYGRAAHQTVELVEVLNGRSQYSRFLDEHGEGVQHIGFWCSDLKAAVAAAVAEGAEVSAASLDQERTAMVPLTPRSAAHDIVSALDQGYAYLNLGLGSVQFEFLGPNSGRGSGLREFLAEEYRKDLPPLPLL